MWWKRRTTPTPVPSRDPDDPASDERDLREIRNDVKGWLLSRISVADAEAKHTVQIDGRGVPFGLINAQWRRLVAQMQCGDELWEFRKRPPEFLVTREGLVLLRCGEPVAAIITALS
jgi:hypothetical protein